MGLLVQRGNIHISHAILGSSDLDQETGLSAKFKSWLIAEILSGMFRKGKLPGFMQRRLAKKPADERLYYDKMLGLFGVGNTQMSFVKKESIRNQFYSDLVTPIENGIDRTDTTVHVFYAVKMGEQYLKRYHAHFKNPDIRCHEMQHEELLVCYPRQWAEEVRECCRLKTAGMHESIER